MWRSRLHTRPHLGQGHFQKHGGGSFLDIGAVPTTSLSAVARHPRLRGPLCHLPARGTTSWLWRAHGALRGLPPPSSSSAARCLPTARRSPVGSVRLAGHPLVPPGLCPAASRVWGAGPARFSLQQNLSCRSRPDAYPPSNSSSTPPGRLSFLGARGAPFRAHNSPSARPAPCAGPSAPHPASGCWGHCGCSGTLVGWTDARAP